MNSNLELIREYKRLTEKCKTLVGLFTNFDNVLDTFEKESGTTVKEAIQILDEIGDNDVNLIRLTIARLTDSIGNVEPIVEVPQNVEILPQVTETTPQVVEVPEVENHEEEFPVQQAVEISSAPESTDTPGLRQKNIRINAEVSATVYDDGTVEVFGNKLVPYLDNRGILKVDIPISMTKQDKTCKVCVHTLVARAFIPKPNSTKKDGVIHKNDNPFDCRVSNLGWRSVTKREIPKIDASDAIDICEALVASRFDIVETITYLATRHKRCSQYAIDRILNKEIFANISDQYFDNKMHAVKCLDSPESKMEPQSESPEPEPQSEQTFDRDEAIRQLLEANDNSLRKAYYYGRITIENLTKYEVFRVKYSNTEEHPNGVGKPSDEDVYEIIRFASSRGEDIRTTILNECNYVVTSTQLTSATRKRV